MKSLKKTTHRDIHKKLAWMEKGQLLKSEDKSKSYLFVILQIINTGDWTLEFALKEI